jgi:ketosteroid isomerase-like protein
MSQENVELVRRLYEWMAAGDTDRAFEAYAPEIEWDVTRAPWLLELGFAPIVRGQDELRRSLKGWLDAWESIEYRPAELVDAGDHVVAFVDVTARGRASGVNVAYDHPQVWTIRDGKVVRMRVFADRAQALEAVGLSEQDVHAES